MDPEDEDHVALEPGEAAPLPPADFRARVDHDGAEIAFCTYGAGAAVILLHGGLGNGEDWGNQVPALVEARYQVILIDSRGHGLSTRDARPFSYEQMADDVLAVMDALKVEKAAVVGWSDGAIIGLVMAMKCPSRVTRVFAFGGNMDLTGTKPISGSDPVIARAFGRAATAYARISPTPTEFKAFSGAIGKLMQTQPNYSAQDLGALRVPIAIVAGDFDEFITREHTDYLARSIPGARRIILPGVTHFAPLQRPTLFNDAMLAFLGLP